MCSFCEGREQQIQHCADPDAKQRLRRELQQHEAEANAKYDIMQNQSLPKLPIGEAFYARQIWQFLLGIVRHFDEDSEQPIDNCHLYTRTEHQAGRGSDVILSALTLARELGITF